MLLPRTRYGTSYPQKSIFAAMARCTVERCGRVKSMKTSPPRSVLLQYLAGIVVGQAPQDLFVAAARRESLSEVTILRPGDEPASDALHDAGVVEEGDLFIEARIKPLPGAEHDLDESVSATAQERLVNVLLYDDGEGVSFASRVCSADPQGAVEPGYAIDETQTEPLNEFAIAVALRVLREEVPGISDVLLPLRD